MEPPKKEYQKYRCYTAGCLYHPQGIEAYCLPETKPKNIPKCPVCNKRLERTGETLLR